MRFLSPLFIVLLSGSSVFAAAPNLYECTGDELQVSYSTSSISGQPTFSITRAEETVSRLGDKIRSEKTVLGNLVTVVRQAIPDYKTDSVSLVIPAINLTDALPEVDFETAVVETTSLTSIGGPQLVQGVVTSSTYETVTCTAKKVVF